jgi:hypothetical protein
LRAILSLVISPVASILEPGLNRHAPNPSRIIFEPMALHGTSKRYIVGRLRRTEGLGHLADAIESGRITSHAVALELGWVRRPRLAGGSTNRAKLRRFQFQKLLREARPNAPRERL